MNKIPPRDLIFPNWLWVFFFVLINESSAGIIKIQDEVDLGIIDPAVSRIEITMPAINTSTSDAVQIIKVAGACSCFKSAKYSERVSP